MSLLRAAPGPPLQHTPIRLPSLHCLSCCSDNTPEPPHASALSARALPLRNGSPQRGTALFTLVPPPISSPNERPAGVATQKLATFFFSLTTLSAGTPNVVVLSVLASTTVAAAGPDELVLDLREGRSAGFLPLHSARSRADICRYVSMSKHRPYRAYNRPTPNSLALSYTPAVFSSRTAQTQPSSVTFVPHFSPRTHQNSSESRLVSLSLSFLISLSSLPPICSYCNLRRSLPSATFFQYAVFQPSEPNFFVPIQRRGLYASSR